MTIDIFHFYRHCVFSNPFKRESNEFNIMSDNDKRLYDTLVAGRLKCLAIIIHNLNDNTVYARCQRWPQWLRTENVCMFMFGR